ncbi:MAG: hypothetical protein JXA52_06965 [Planctomycetes bacterium]|nr:hypothetical protein [Planctomycetota bacterium]
MRYGLWQCLLDWRVRYISLGETIRRWFNHRDYQYSIISLADTAKRYKHSDTVFILGGSELINDITESQWAHIEQHESFGMNWWPLHPFVPTYYQTNYPRQRHAFWKLAEAIQKRKEEYHKTVFFVSGDRALRRGVHPRVLPEYFSVSPTCCCYHYPQPIKLRADEEFKPEHFAETVYYRGGLTLILHLLICLGYRRIVLMGVDLRNRVHFYDDYPETEWMVKESYSLPIAEKENILHGTMDDKDGSKIPMDQYLYAIQELAFAPRGIELFVGSPKSLLATKLPVYRF